MTPVQHFVVLDGQRHGPFTLTQLRGMWTNGQVNMQTQHFMDGYTEWMPLGFIREDLEEPAFASTAVMPRHPQQQVMVVAKSRGAFVALGLFLGGLGIHNFYAGYIGRAVTQLLIFFVLGWLIFPLAALWLWSLIEVIAVDKDATGVKMR